MSSYPPAPSYSEPGHSPAGPPSIDQPYPGAPLGVAVRRFFTKYATFSGRASRSEYWWWTLVAVLVSVVLNILSRAVGGGSMMMGSGHMNAGTSVISIISLLWSLATVVPSLALAWRRLHDTNRSGGWWFLILIPFVGVIILIVWFASASRPEGARFDR